MLKFSFKVSQRFSKILVRVIASELAEAEQEDGNTLEVYQGLVGVFENEKNRDGEKIQLPQNLIYYLNVFLSIVGSISTSFSGPCTK